MQRVAIVVYVDRVASIRTAIVPNNDIVFLSEEIGDLSFTFVTKLETNYSSSGNSRGCVVHGSNPLTAAIQWIRQMA
jgi:hypothetical protein